MTKRLQKYGLFVTALLIIQGWTGFAQEKDSAKATATPPLITVSEKSPAATTQDVKSGASVDKIIESFFTLLGKNKVDDAYDQLTIGTKIAEKTGDVMTLKSKTKDAIKLFGEIQGYELVGIKNVGTHLMCSTYLSLGKTLPLRWKFYFYKSDKSWKLVDIRVDDGLVNMFDEKKPGSQSADAGQ